jgi:hypothetical protein
MIMTTCIPSPCPYADALDRKLDRIDLAVRGDGTEANPGVVGHVRSLLDDRRRTERGRAWRMAILASVISAVVASVVTHVIPTTAHAEVIHDHR